MKACIVADASPLIALAKLDCLGLLLFSFNQIHIPRAVYQETTRDRYRKDSQQIVEFVQQHAHIHENKPNPKYEQFKIILDEGESQALCLAAQLNCALLIDERLGRKVAQQQKMPIVGVMGVLLQAKNKGYIQRISPLIEQLQAHQYRLSDKVIEIVLRKANEI